MELLGNGYGDRDLSFVCHKCGGEINHDLLRVAKFKKDTENLIMKDWPLGGTILEPITGTPEAPDNKQWPIYHNTFPNRLVGMELRGKILDMITPSNNPTMNDVKVLIEEAIKNRSVVRKVNSGGVGISRPESLSIRKMMSRYWENTSVFALELGGAVIRQGIFVDKMHSIDWLHSPAAGSTMNRLLTKYSRFITIIAQNPRVTVVPTLDIDLAWHTHQLSPSPYFQYTFLKCYKYIDHDDKINEETLSSGFEWTSKTYEKLFGEIYSECTW